MLCSSFQHYGTRGPFRGIQFSIGRGWVNGSGGNASDGQMKLHLLASQPAVWPVPNRSMARGLGTPVLWDC